MAGMRPIVEVMTVNFSLLALDQIVNNAATILHMSGGQFNVPLVIRMTTGAGRQLAAQHAHSWEGWYAHIPGIRVLVPARSRMRAACSGPPSRIPDPVLIFENGTLYNLEGELPDPPAEVDIETRRDPPTRQDVSADHVWRRCRRRSKRPMSSPSRGSSAEVLDLRVLRPLDTPAILESVTRTHRAVVVDEGWRTGSISAEVSARIMEGALWELEAPVERVCSAEVPMPYAVIWSRRPFRRSPASWSGTSRGRSPWLSTGSPPWARTWSRPDSWNGWSERATQSRRDRSSP
jgi:pyruvate dehydrogenase E1 component beta subunit